MSQTSFQDGHFHAEAAEPPEGFTHHTSEIRGVNMHWVAGGSGLEVVLLLHGWPQNWFEWRLIMPALARRFTVLAIDLPGLGDSDGSPNSFDEKTLAGFVHELVAERLHHQHVHLVGHDFGAGVAFAYAAFHREAASSLAIMGFPVMPGPGTNQQAIRGQLWWFGFHAVPEIPEQLVAGREAVYLNWFFEKAIARGNRIEPAAVSEYVRTFRKPGVLRHGFELYRSIATDETTNASLTDNKLTLPVLYMDQMSTPGSLTLSAQDVEDRKARLAAAIQPMVAGQLAVELVPDSGHFIPEENPDFVISKLTHFFDLINVKA